MNYYTKILQASFETVYQYLEQDYSANYLVQDWEAFQRIRHRMKCPLIPIQTDSPPFIPHTSWLPAGSCTIAGWHTRNDQAPKYVLAWFSGGVFTTISNSDISSLDPSSYQHETQ